MIDGFEGHSYPAMPERPDSWFNPDESDDPFDEPLEELEVIEDDEEDDDDDDKAWQE